MRIAQVSPLYESVPPKMYGGTERVVHFLTEELVRQGHEVVLYASGDSQTSATLRSVCPRALRLDKDCRDYLSHHILQLEKVFTEAEQFDIVHFHVDYMHFPLSRRMHKPQLTTLHGRLDLRELVPLYREFLEMPLVSISDSQREPLRFANWIGTVLHGLPQDLLVPGSGNGGYLAFLGRISPEKRCDRAIEIAAAIGMPLRIAAKVDKVDEEYYEEVIKPLIDQHPNVEFVGEVNEREKQEFLGNAAALLFPIDWPEPFGLVMIEAMACGTPVVAFRRGSVPEIIDDGVSGLIVEDMNGAIEAARRALSMDRVRVREAFDGRFTAERMARDYVRLYEQLALTRNAAAHSRFGAREHIA